VVSEDEQGDVVLFAEEFEAGGIVERVDVVLLGEFEGERAFEGVDVGEGELHDVGAGRAAEQERRFGVFGGLGLALFEGALGARVFGFSGVRVSYSVLYISSRNGQ